jgi:predicted DNA-binding transcriptional regulator YafY
MRARASAKTKYNRASITKTFGGPNHAMRNPAIGGPPTPLRVKVNISSALAVARCSGATSDLSYRSPYHVGAEHLMVEPYAVFWDRGYWYLVGSPINHTGSPSLWRADRVTEIHPRTQSARVPATFDVREQLGRKWLERAMRSWGQEAPVRIRVTPRQAARLRDDWYYGRATFEPVEGDAFVMSFGEADAENVFELIRWLGPGAELLEPAAWRTSFATQLANMLSRYESSAAE